MISRASAKAGAMGSNSGNERTGHVQATAAPAQGSAASTASARPDPGWLGARLGVLGARAIETVAAAAAMAPPRQPAASIHAYSGTSVPVPASDASASAPPNR